MPSTKGPWKCSPEFNKLFKKDIDSYTIHDGFDTICNIQNYSNAPEDSRDNALLITASPTMKTALEQLPELLTFIEREYRGATNHITDDDACTNSINMARNIVIEAIAATTIHPQLKTKERPKFKTRGMEM